MKDSATARKYWQRATRAGKHWSRAVTSSQDFCNPPLPEVLAVRERQIRMMGGVSREEVARVVTVSRLSRTRQKDTTRFQMRVRDQELNKVITVGLCQGGAGHTTGKAPPSHHERTLSKHLSWPSGQQAQQHPILNAWPRTSVHGWSQESLGAGPRHAPLTRASVGRPGGDRTVSFRIVRCLANAR